MSLIKIDGCTLSVSDLSTWIGSFVMLYRKKKISIKKMPAEITAIMDKQADDNTAMDEIIAYLIDNQNYIKTLMDIVRGGASEMILEKK